MSAPLAPGIPEIIAPELPLQGWGGWFFTEVGRSLDGAVLQAMRFVIDAALMPRPEDLPALRASAARFLAGELRDEPRRFFAIVDEPAAPLEVTSRVRRRIEGGVVLSRRFATAYRPSGDAIAPGNEDRIHVEHWVHDPDRTRATVVALHGFSMGYPWIDGFALFAAQLFRRGFDVALVTLPFHGKRSPADARFSGERFAVPDVARLNEAVRQAIYEIHVLVGWLRQETGAPVGLLGLSLGGYLSALMAGLTASLDFVIPMVPPVCMGDLAWRFFERSRHHRERPATAFSREELRTAYGVHSPLTYPCRVEKRRLMILAGRGDQIVPPDHPHALWRHWGEPKIVWFNGSHLAPFGRGRLLRAIVDHIGGTLPPYSPNRGGLPTSTPRAG